MILKYIVTKNNETINQILKSKLHISSRLLYKLINKKVIYLNNQICDTRNIANKGNLLSVDLSYDEDNSNVVATKMNLNIVFEDDAILVLNKPAGISTHPSILHFEDSLSNGVKYYFDCIGLHKKIRPVNRLDLNTSGLIIFAKNEYIQECLIKQMENNSFKKEYHAVIIGHLENKKGTIDKPIARKQNSIIERCIDENGKKAVTHYEVVKEFDNCSLVKCTLETGRTHQIRVHFASIGHPLLGDSLYGEKSDLIDGQALSCTKLSFIHPVSNKKIVFEAEKSFVLN